MLTNWWKKHFSKTYEVYTDGSFKDGRGSWAYVMTKRGIVIAEASGQVRKSSSNQMEFQAAIEVLQKIPRAAKVILYSDSRILVNTMNVLAPQWRSLGWVKKNGTQISQEDQVKKLFNLSQERRVSWTWIRAHAGNRFNERCDEMCILARSKNY